MPDWIVYSLITDCWLKFFSHFSVKFNVFLLGMSIATATAAVAVAATMTLALLCSLLLTLARDLSLSIATKHQTPFLHWNLSLSPSHHHHVLHLLLVVVRNSLRASSLLFWLIFTLIIPSFLFSVAWTISCYVKISFCNIINCIYYVAIFIAKRTIYAPESMLKLNFLLVFFRSIASEFMGATHCSDRLKRN